MSGYITRSRPQTRNPGLLPLAPPLPVGATPPSPAPPARPSSVPSFLTPRLPHNHLRSAFSRLSTGLGPFPSRHLPPPSQPATLSSAFSLRSPPSPNLLKFPLSYVTPGHAQLKPIPQFQGQGSARPPRNTVPSRGRQDVPQRQAAVHLEPVQQRRRGGFRLPGRHTQPAPQSYWHSLGCMRSKQRTQGSAAPASGPPPVAGPVSVKMAPAQ